MCEKHHHSHVPPEETKVIEHFIAKMNKSINFIPDLRSAFCAAIHQISSPMDLYQHNELFKKHLNSLDIQLRWGAKASHRYRHAYVIPFDEGQGEIYTILTNVDLSEYDKSIFPWESYDLFHAEKKEEENRSKELEKKVAYLEKQLTSSIEAVCQVAHESVDYVGKANYAEREEQAHKWIDKAWEKYHMKGKSHEAS